MAASRASCQGEVRLYTTFSMSDANSLFKLTVKSQSLCRGVFLHQRTRHESSGWLRYHLRGPGLGKRGSLSLALSQHAVFNKKQPVGTCPAFLLFWKLCVFYMCFDTRVWHLMKENKARTVGESTAPDFKRTRGRVSARGDERQTVPCWSHSTPHGDPDRASNGTR